MTTVFSKALADFVREEFIKPAVENMILSIDFADLEKRVMAHYSGVEPYLNSPHKLPPGLSPTGRSSVSSETEYQHLRYTVEPRSVPPHCETESEDQT